MKQKEIKVEKEVHEDLLLKNLEELKGKTVTLREKADIKGHLFSQVHKKEIIEAMHGEHHAEISEEFIVLEKPIKEVGEFEIPVTIKDKKSSFKLIIEKI
jgi:large subunit ribosomal protein L9